MENVGLHTGADPWLKAPGNPLYRGYPITQAGEVLGEVVEVGSALQEVALGERFVSYANSAKSGKIPEKSDFGAKSDF